VQLPFWRPLAFKLRERLGWKVVYDCMDKHSGFSTNDPAMLDEEMALSRGSDLVAVTAAVLHEEQKPLARECALVPNACQFEHFSASFGPPPAAVAKLPGPVVGYYGAISDWFDTAMVAEMARLRPNWSFPLIGNTFGADLTPLKDLPNVHLLGEQPYAALPNFTQAFDVCMIPFKITPLTEATNPVKFFEYLSAGKPVVSVPLPELLPYVGEGVVALANTAAGMVASVEDALKNNGPDAVAQRQRVARQNTWEERFGRLNSAVARLYRRVSIIVLTYNNLNLNRLCIESIFRNTAWPDFELIVVDNASTDGTPDYLRQVERTHTNVRLFLNDRNRGFAGGNNQAIRAAHGDYVVLLNNDTIVTRGWLGRLIRHLEGGEKVGLVGPVTNSAGNEAVIDTEYVTLDGMEAFAAARSYEYAGQSMEIKVPALFCAIARRALFDEVGLLDERYEVGLFEDDDLALRVRRAGYRNLCAQDVFIHHFQSESFKLLGDEAYQRIFAANRERFEKKWNTKWEPHRHRPAA
jgi:GT2 family glycosyltransferase